MPCAWQPWEGVTTLECTLVDETGGLTVIFMGRQRIGGVNLGARLEVAGTVIESRGHLALMNPEYTLLPREDLALQRCGPEPRASIARIGDGVEYEPIKVGRLPDAVELNRSMSLTQDRSAIAPLPHPQDRRPRPVAFRVKSKILGKALNNDQLAHERLGKPTALAVFASDALSSTAYASEEILRTLLFGGAGIGLAAFSYLVPITIVLVTVLVILTFSYRQTIKAYPSAGGAYIVTKDNLGLLPAQVAGVALLTDYILTVAVSTSAGVAALYSVVPSLYAWRVPRWPSASSPSSPGATCAA